MGKRSGEEDDDVIWSDIVALWLIQPWHFKVGFKLEGIGGNAWWEGYKHNCVDMVSRDLFVIKQKVAFFFLLFDQVGVGSHQQTTPPFNFFGG